MRPEWLPNEALRRVDEEPRSLVESCTARIAVWEEQVLSADCDDLRDHAVEARRDGLDPAAAVDAVVHAALADPVLWEKALSRLACGLVELSTREELRGLHPDAVDAGWDLDERLAWARLQLFSIVAEYHHGSADRQQRPPAPVAVLFGRRGPDAMEG